MTRTRIAALQAAGGAFTLIAATALVLGIGLVPALLSGLVAGAIGGALLLAAAGRAGTAHDDPTSDGAGSDTSARTDEEA